LAIYLLLCLLMVACRGDGPVEEVADVVSTPDTAVTEPDVQVAYPVTPMVAEADTAVSAYPSSEESTELFLPHVGQAGATLTPTPPEPTPIPTATPIVPLDFDAIRADLLANGQELAYVQIGFHAGIGGNSEGLEEWMRRLDAAGIPFFLKSTDNAEPLYIAQELKRQSGVPHTLVFRRASGQAEPSAYSYDVPNYDLPPAEAARVHWDLHLAEWPPELDPEMIWVETINEVDRNRSEWLAEFSLATAELAFRDGFRWAAFGWASGEPEPAHWQSPAMLQFLRLAGENPDRLAIAVHEYSYVTDNIRREYPYLLGRFKHLFLICDRYNIPRPTVLVTEWGWTHQEVPPPEQAISDIAWASSMYARYPEVKGAAIWYLGIGFGGIADLAQQLIEPLTEYALLNYHTRPVPPTQTQIDPALFE
jgi:hypothetical protein